MLETHHKKSKKKMQRHQIERVRRTGTRLTVYRTLSDTETRDAESQLDQRQSMISARNVEQLKFLQILTLTYVFFSIKNCTTRHTTTIRTL